MVKIYTKRTCGYCHMAKQLLSSQGIHFDEVDVIHDHDGFKHMVSAASGHRTVTVPQIFINDEAIGGFMELATSSQSGTLNILVNN